MVFGVVPAGDGGWAAVVAAGAGAAFVPAAAAAAEAAVEVHAYPFGSRKRIYAPLRVCLQLKRRWGAVTCCGWPSEIPALMKKSFALTLMH